MKVICLRIGLLPRNTTLRLQQGLNRRLWRDEVPSTSPEDENHYWAAAIKDGIKYYYRVNDTILKISEDQFFKVVSNPYLYYFSTALKLHKRIERVKQLQRIDL